MRILVGFGCRHSSCHTFTGFLQSYVAILPEVVDGLLAIAYAAAVVEVSAVLVGQVTVLIAHVDGLLLMVGIVVVEVSWIHGLRVAREVP